MKKLFFSGLLISGLLASVGLLSANQPSTKAAAELADLRAALTSSELAYERLLAQKPWVDTQDMKGKAMEENTSSRCQYGDCFYKKLTTTCTASEQFCLAHGECIYRCTATDTTATDEQWIPYGASTAITTPVPTELLP
jgi:hypothetical protein